MNKMIALVKNHSTIEKINYYAREYLNKKFKSEFNFFEQYKGDRTHTGAIMSSSKSLSSYITDIVNLSEKNFVVELGSGIGVFTKQIIQKMSKSSIFFSLEINPYFVEETRKNCPSATVYQDDAKYIQEYLKKYDSDNCDCIVSGLPWSCFNQKQQEDLLDTIYGSLEDGGEFATFAYVQSAFLPRGIKFKKLLESRFKVVIQTKTIWNNLPPAFIYYCKK